MLVTEPSGHPSVGATFSTTSAEFERAPAGPYSTDCANGPGRSGPTTATSVPTIMFGMYVLAPTLSGRRPLESVSSPTCRPLRSLRTDSAYETVTVSSNVHTPFSPPSHGLPYSMTTEVVPFSSASKVHT